MTLLQLGLSCLNKKKLSRSSQFRAQRLLQRPLASFCSAPLPLSESMRRIVSTLAQCAPLTKEDFVDVKDQKLFEQLRDFPQDRAFFRMFLRQDQIFKKYSEQTAEEFFLSDEGRRWIESARRIKRPLCFFLETTFYPTRQTSLKAEIDLKRLLRRNPLLRYSDLKTMGFRNIQATMERFPQLTDHRERHLKKLGASLAQSK